MFKLIYSFRSPSIRMFCQVHGLELIGLESRSSFLRFSIKLGVKESMFVMRLKHALSSTRLGNQETT